MPVIVVANPKGGVGKTTLATNIAGYYASRGHKVMLGDVDRQQSARTWLALRPAGLAPIAAWEVTHDEVVRPPKGTLQPSIFDIHATHEFVRQLLAHKRSERVQIAIVGMRTREGTISTDQLRGFLDGLKLPLLGFLRDTQNYVHLAAHGLTLWDVGSSRFERDTEQWQPLTQWLGS